MSAFGDENIGGLYVPVDNAFGVSGIECVGNFDSQTEQYIRFDWPARDAMLERYAIEKLHHDEWMLADFVNGADVRMVQGRGSFSFSLETGKSLRVLR